VRLCFAFEKKTRRGGREREGGGMEGLNSLHTTIVTGGERGEEREGWSGRWWLSEERGGGGGF